MLIAAAVVVGDGGGGGGVCACRVRQATTAAGRLSSSVSTHTCASDA